MKVSGTVTSVVRTRGWKNEPQAVVNIQTDGAAAADMHVYVARTHPLAKADRGQRVCIEVAS